MNKHLLHKDVQDFITTHLKADITKLVLKGSPFETVTIQEIAEQIVAKQKCEKKLPTWFHTPQIYYPNKLNIEQTSSETLANYKSNLVKGNSLIDITGGFGVDTYYFSKRFKTVTHCEINEGLSQIVNYNYNILQTTNITTIATDGLAYLKNTNQQFDCIYVDPSRRDKIKGKVFLVEDCIPNIPNELDFLFTKTKVILLKYSPILDIQQALHTLKFVKEVHITALKNEVKELLFILEKSFSETPIIYTINKTNQGEELYQCNVYDKLPALFELPQTYLYEPNAAILKAGAFNQISRDLKLSKLQQHSHLYTSEKLVPFPGRAFKIEHCIAYDKKLLQKLLPSKKANITTRNFPDTVAQIRKKTKLKDGGEHYLFFTTNLKNQLIVLLCKKLVV